MQLPEDAATGTASTDDTSTATVATDAAAPHEAAAVVEAAAVAAPELVEVWRPGGRSEERRPRHGRNRHRNQASFAAPQPLSRPPPPKARARRASVKREDTARRRQIATPIFSGQRPTRNDSKSGHRGAGRCVGCGRRERQQGSPPRDRFQDRDRDKDSDRSIRSKAVGDKGRRQGQIGGAPERRPSEVAVRTVAGRDPPIRDQRSLLHATAIARSIRTRPSQSSRR